MNAVVPASLSAAHMRSSFNWRVENAVRIVAAEAGIPTVIADQQITFGFDAHVVDERIAYRQAERPQGNDQLQRRRVMQRIASIIQRPPRWMFRSAYTK